MLLEHAPWVCFWLGCAHSWGAGIGADFVLLDSELTRRVSPAGEVLLLVLPRRSTQEESAPAASPGFAGVSALLSRNGGLRTPRVLPAGRTRAAPLKQSSPLFPLRLALLDDAKG